MREVQVKWAFGNAPMKLKTQVERWEAVTRVYDYLMTVRLCHKITALTFY